jgi:hypothetical protein
VQVNFFFDKSASKLVSHEIFKLREVLNIIGDFTQELQENNMICYFKKKRKTITLYFIGNMGELG